MDRSSVPTTVRAWSPSIPGVREVFHARTVDHAYPPHTHDTWTLFIVDRGGVRYGIDRYAREAPPGRASILPPHVMHDGRPADEHGYAMRVLYLEPDVIGERLIGPAVDRPVVSEPSVYRRLASVHEALACADDAFEAELELAAVVDRVRQWLGAVDDEPPALPERALAEAFRAYLDANLFERVTVAEAARTLGAGPTRLAHAFSRAFSLPPHEYVTARRLDAARARILAGQPLADVAAAVGFCDQAHLTRRFKRFLGTTPARYARARP